MAPEMKRTRGFTFVELLTAIAILSILVALSAFALGRATHDARVSGVRFDVVNTLQFAKDRALATGRDVYVVFANLDSTERWPRENTARVLVYEDPDALLRTPANLADVMSVVGDAANQQNVLQDLMAGGRVFGDSGLAFVDGEGNPVPGCDADRIPVYMPVTDTRVDRQSCAAFCTFCDAQPSGCTGAIRFMPDGSARIVTGGPGTGGLVRLVDPEDARRGACVAISEPNGLAVLIPGT